MVFMELAIKPFSSKIVEGFMGLFLELLVDRRYVTFIQQVRYIENQNCHIVVHSTIT